MNRAVVAVLAIIGIVLLAAANAGIFWIYTQQEWTIEEQHSGVGVERIDGEALILQEEQVSADLEQAFDRADAGETVVLDERPVDASHIIVSGEETTTVYGIQTTYGAVDRVTAFAIVVFAGSLDFLAGLAATIGVLEILAGQGLAPFRL